MRAKREKHEAEIGRLEEEVEQRLRDVESWLGNYEERGTFDFFKLKKIKGTPPPSKNGLIWKSRFRRTHAYQKIRLSLADRGAWMSKS